MHSDKNTPCLSNKPLKHWYKRPKALKKKFKKHTLQKKQKMPKVMPVFDLPENLVGEMPCWSYIVDLRWKNRTSVAVPANPACLYSNSFLQMWSKLSCHICHKDPSCRHLRTCSTFPNVPLCSVQSGIWEDPFGLRWQFILQRINLFWGIFQEKMESYCYLKYSIFQSSCNSTVT